MPMLFVSCTTVALDQELRDVAVHDQRLATIRACRFAQLVVDDLDVRRSDDRATFPYTPMPCASPPLRPWNVVPMSCTTLPTIVM